MSTEDHHLIERVVNGDRDAFRPLVERYQTVVYNVAFRVLGNRPDAEDVSQTVFLKVYQNLSSYNPKHRFFSWMYRIALNEALNLKKRKRPLDTLGEQMEAVDRSPEEEMFRSDAEDRIGDALMVLTPENRAIVILRHYQNFSYHEISWIMELTEAKVKSRLFTARRQLGKYLEAQGLRSAL